MKALAVFPEKKGDLYPYSIDLDNYSAGRFAAEKLLKANKRTMACLIPDDSTESKLDRWQGFCDAVTCELGTAPALCKLPSQASEIELLKFAADFTSSNRPDAIMSVDALSGKLALASADKLNITVPDDLAIIGFDCYHLEDEHHRRISAVATSWWKAGQIAAESILDMVINHTEWTEPRRLAPVFLPGDTTPADSA